MWEGGTNLYAITRTTTNGTVTTVSSPPLHNNWNEYKIVWDAEAATPKVEFYVNGSLVATHTTNIPNTAAEECRFGFAMSAANNGMLVAKPNIYLKTA